MTRKLTLAMLFFSLPATAQQAVSLPTPVQPAAAANAEACCRLPAGTEVDLEILETINSSQRKRGESFRLRVTVPVLVDGRIVIPAGTPGTGEIVHAAAARGGGAAGELLLAARTLDLDGRTIRLRGFKVGRSGQDKTALAVGMATVIGPFAMFIRGREVEIPEATEAVAKVAEDVVVPSAANTSSTQME